ncbi:MAG TPA: hypothetical protein VNA04_03090 [Thermoanaerobaculia bacterium]|nr:hypothetical protein [Thermoanaerobaculia bacterium]
MTIDPIWIWIAAGAVAVLVVVALIARGVRRSRSEALRERFGAEYDHAVQATGKRGRAEEELIARTEEVKTFDIRALTAEEHRRFRTEWDRIEARFLERPVTTVVEADELVGEIMRTRGYPMGDFEKHAAHLSVDHPRVVEHYRAGHAAIGAERDGRSSTEQLRQAMLHYRALIDELLGGQRTDLVSDVPVQSEVESPRSPVSAERPREDDALRPDH